MSKNESVMIAVAVMAFLYIVMELYRHYFPSKPAFTTEGDFKKFLSINEKQYKEIMAEARKAHSKDVMDLLRKRDDQFNKSIEDADKKLRSVVSDYSNDIKNLCAKNAAADMASWMFLMSQLHENKMLKDVPDDIESRHTFFTQLYFMINPGAKDLVFVKTPDVKSSNG